jgi:hypothetical protein
MIYIICIICLSSFWKEFLFVLCSPTKKKKIAHRRTFHIEDIIISIEVIFFIQIIHVKSSRNSRRSGRTCFQFCLDEDHQKEHVLDFDKNNNESSFFFFSQQSFFYYQIWREISIACIIAPRCSGRQDQLLDCMIFFFDLHF